MSEFEAIERRIAQLRESLAASQRENEQLRARLSEAEKDAADLCALVREWFALNKDTDFPLTADFMLHVRIMGELMRKIEKHAALNPSAAEKAHE